MHLDIKTLDQADIDMILQTFNASFADYTVPMELTGQQLTNKIRKENIKFEMSVGAFHNEKLVGFILHGVETRQGRMIAYNAATGVVPSSRGLGLTQQLYAAILPLLKENGVHEIHLEVITSNIPALRSYQKMGFGISRRLLCYKGRLAWEKPVHGSSVIILDDVDWKTLRSFWDWHPSWQQSEQRIGRAGVNIVTIGRIIASNIVGYACYDPVAKRVVQFAVHPDFRRTGVATSLFSYLSFRFGPEFTVINVDSTANETIAFLFGIGLREFIQQHEMVFEIDMR